MPRENEKKLIQKIQNRINNQSEKDLKDFMSRILTYETSITGRSSWRTESYPSMIEEVIKSSNN